jgi:penicillin-binding protein 2
MAFLLVEKYLTDSLRTERLAEVERIANANLMPSWLPREQYKQDSIRAYQWYKLTNDSIYIKKYVFHSSSAHRNDHSPENKNAIEKGSMLLREKKDTLKKKINRII